MIDITLGDRHLQTRGEAGQTLLDAAHAGGVPLRYACRRADCGTCAVAVTGAGLEAPGEAEVALLRHLGLDPAASRLACQARLAKGPVALRVILRP